MLWEVVQQPRLAFRAERLARRGKHQLEAYLAAFARGKKMLLARRQGDRGAARPRDLPGVNSSRLDRN